jgi:hypothetical protein
VGAFFTPGRRCRPGHRDLDDRRLPLLNGQPSTPLEHPIGGGWDYEAYEDSLTFTRPVFPLPTIPGWNENGFGFFPGLRTPRSPMTHAKAGTIHFDTGPGHTLNNRASNRCNHSSRATFASHVG